LAHVTFIIGGMWWCSWLRHYTTSWKVAGSIPDGVIGNFHWYNSSDSTMALGSTQPLTEMSIRNIYKDYTKMHGQQNIKKKPNLGTHSELDTCSYEPFSLSHQLIISPTKIPTFPPESSCIFKYNDWRNTEILVVSKVSPGMCQGILSTSKQVTYSSLHILSNLLFTDHPITGRYVRSFCLSTSVCRYLPLLCSAGWLG
jgi:hypothetical protein